ncbi:MAG TPA: BTAD domain-containing putative transcriptional regulator [Streptosporangiaceae bacterium]|nr:BTAD domain-containing putative transcriptional regulator [Streptosporangiaceae bacterium]
MPEVPAPPAAVVGGRQQPAGPLRVQVIGSVSVSSGDRIVAGQALGGRRARVALVALALADGPVTADRLAAILWSDEPPRTWPAALRGVIRGLRAGLAEIGAGGQRVIATMPSGYGLAADVAVDLRRAMSELRAATALADQGRHEAALAAAGPVALLSGEQLLPGEDASWLDPYRVEADAVALRALEILARSAGEMGDHHRAAAAGRRAAAAFPLDERAHRILIQALRGGGDRAAVVRAYEACRAVLGDQLGVDPDPETVAAYLAALGEAGPAGAAGAARLPQAASAFVGRDAEVARLAAAIEVPGLVTLAGQGGIGKSRLALQVAAPAQYAGGKLWVSLATVPQDELVASAVAMSIGLPVGNDDAAALLAGHLAPLGRVLLVLDGSEVVLDGAASLVSSLLALCPTLTVLVTTRAPLAIEAEQVISIEPLPPTAQVRLLADRVRGGGGQLVQDEATAPFVAELCRRCGGLPLAIELAAAQLAAMSLPDLLDHLPGLIAEGGDWLRGVATTSYELLDEDEATVFRRFGVIDGPAALPLVREVVAGGRIAPVRVVRILRELTARGLLAVDRSGVRWQYYQDDDLHHLARELLDAAAETDQATERLADAVSAIIPENPTAPPGPYLDAIGEVLTSVRSLLGAAIDGRLPRERGLELAFRLHRYWAGSNVSEGRFWLSRLLADALPSPGTGHAAYALGYLSYWSGDTAAAARELQAAVEMLAGQPDPFAARALIYLGGLADDVDRGEEALDFVRRSIEAAATFGTDLQIGAAIGMGCVLAERADRRAAGYAADAIEACRRGGSREQLAGTLPTAAMVCWQVGELAAASRYVAEAMPLLAGSRRIARVVLLTVAAGVALAEGDLEAAIELGTNADVDASDLGIERELPLARCIVARALLDRGDVEAAAAMARRAVEATRTLTFSFPLAVCLETAALICLRQPAGADVSSRLLAAAGRIRARGDRPGPPTLRAAVDQARSAAGLAPAARSAAAGVGDDQTLDVRAVADLAISALGPAEIGAISQSAAPA